MAHASDGSPYPWYDSLWLKRYVQALAIVRATHPEQVSGFEDAFRSLRTRADYQVTLLERVFDEDVFREIRRTVASLRPNDLETHEARTFGRFVVHGHPFFTELQERLVSVVSQVVGEPVEAGYNFLSLYSGVGVCPFHMDAPEAKWTLDLCIDQSAPWPIWFSDVQPWPESGLDAPGQGWEDAVKNSSNVRFTSCTLHPGQAVVFSGSSQWHYRDAIPRVGSGRQFCDLLFFHFIPHGTKELIDHRNWAALFDIPELAQVV